MCILPSGAIRCSGHAPQKRFRLFRRVVLPEVIPAALRAADSPAEEAAEEAEAPGNAGIRNVSGQSYAREGEAVQTDR